MVSENEHVESPLVSVCVQTYQHASFIREALDSILMQKTDFDFEILLGEDESTDGTREICIEYAEKHPQIIRLFLNSRKNVICIYGKPTGRWNFVNNIKNAQGKYIALLPGDDYWTDPLKLQKQVDFMEANPEYILCQHKTLLKLEYGFSESDILYCPKDELNIHDILARNIFSAGSTRKIIRTHTSSSLFRMSIFQNGFPPRFAEAFNGDHYLYLWASLHGKIRVLNDVMSVYRKHPKGISSARFDSRRKYEKAFIDMYRFFQQVLPDKYFYEVEYIIQGLQLIYELKYFSNGIGDTYIGRLKHAVWIWKNFIQKRYDQVALFGAGDHTQRFLSLIKDNNLNCLKMIYDCNPGVSQISGIPVKKAVSSEQLNYDVIVLSTLQFQESMRKSIYEIFGSDILVFDLYEDY